MSQPKMEANFKPTPIDGLIPYDMQGEIQRLVDAEAEKGEIQLYKTQTHTD